MMRKIKKRNNKAKEERHQVDTYLPTDTFVKVKDEGAIDKRYLNNNTKELFCILNVLSGALRRYIDNSYVALSKDLLKSFRMVDTYINKTLHYLSSGGIDIDFQNKNRSANKLNNKLFFSEVYAKDIKISDDEYKEFVELRVAYITVKDLFEKVKLEKKTQTYCKYILTYIGKFYDDIEKGE